MVYKRVDNNQTQIVKALRDMGCTVEHLHAVGKGCPDIIVGFKGRRMVFCFYANNNDFNNLSKGLFFYS